MAATNEDVVVLATATASEGDAGLLVMRHLPDRATIEIGWWNREASGGIVPGPVGLELAAEAVEVDAVARLCESLLAGADWAAAPDGTAFAETPAFPDGASVAAVRSGAGLTLVRRPEGGELVLPTQAALGRLRVLFPAAREKLAALGFGLVQQGDEAPPGA